MIVVKDLYKSYGKKEVLKGLSLEIKTGETLVIVGRSGIGKSVLLKHIIGIEKPDSGEIFVDEINLTSLKEPDLYQVTRDMGMLFQASALFDSMTVADNVGFYLREHKFAREKEIKDLVSNALHVVGLEGTENLMPSDLSGGMRKRAALARMIIYGPKILLYDEPTTGLDPITAMQINDLMNQIQKELHATSVIVTHDICSAVHVADRIALSHEGKIVYIATRDEFFKIDDPIVQSFLKNSIPNGDVRAR